MNNNRNGNKRARTSRPAGSTDAVLHARLIRIPDKQAMNRAVMVLGEVRVPYCGFADSQLLVTREHIEVLEQEEIPFEDVP